MSFKNFNLSEPTLKALHEKGYHKPMPIQQEAISQIISRKDVVGSAQTGTETYTHRIGRIGRAGATGSTFSLCDVSKRSYLKNINRISARKLATSEHPFV